MQFNYVAEDAQKKRKKGSIEADSKPHAMQLLMKDGLFPVSIVDVLQDEREKNENIFTRDISFVSIYNKKISKKKLLTFANQMAIMVKAGVSLTTAMDVLTTEESDKSLKKILEHIRADLHLGVHLSDAMKKFKAFPEIVISMVEAGETDGRLDSAFERIARYMNKDLQLTSKVKSASIYPLFLMVLTVGIVVVISAFVLPRFAAIFENFDAELPGITRVMMGFSNFLTTKWYWILLVIGLLAGAWILLRNSSEVFRLAIGRLSLKLPVIGKLQKRVYAARFCEVLSSMSLAGIDITQGFLVTANTIKNAYIYKILMQNMDDIRLGSSISAAVSKNNAFDKLLLSMIHTGEESGMLPETLGKMAELYEEQTNESIKAINALLEPLMTVLIAGIVGVVVISMVLPMFGMYDLF